MWSDYWSSSVSELASDGPGLLLSVLGLGRNLFVHSESKFLRVWPLHWHTDTRQRGSWQPGGQGAHKSVNSLYYIIP